MEFKKNIRGKSKYYILIFFLLFTMFALIYPHHHYSGGIDTNRYQIVSNGINHYGRIPYLMHPISAWGQYPFSLSVGTPVFMSVAQLLTGIHMIQNVIILDFFLGLFLTLTSVSLFLKIKKDFMFVFGSSLVLALSPRFIAYYTGLFEARGLIATTFPFWLLIIVLYYRNDIQKKYLYLIGFTFFVISLIHLNFLFFTPVLISMFLIKVEDDLKKIFHIKERINKFQFRNYRTYRITRHRLSKGLFWFSLFIFFSFFLLYLGESGLVSTIRYDPGRFGEGGYISGYGAIGALGNMLISMAGGSGWGFFMFGVIGFFVAFSVQRKTTIDSLFLFSFVFSIPFMATAVYFRPFFAIYAAFFTGYGLYWFKKQKKFPVKKMLAISLTILVIGTCFFTPFMVNRWAVSIPANIIHSSLPEEQVTSDDYYIGEYVFQTGVYLRYNHDINERYAHHNKPIDFERLEVISKMPRYGNPQSINEIENIVAQDRWSVVRTGQLHDPYTSHPEIRFIYPRFFSGDLESMEELAIERNITIAYTSTRGEISDRFLLSLDNNRYRIYENEKDVLWRF